MKILYGDRVGRMQGVKASQKHRWMLIEQAGGWQDGSQFRMLKYLFCLVQMRPDQVWIFSQFDSRRLVCVPHAAVDLKGGRTDARPRRSIESRCIVRFTD